LTFQKNEKKNLVDEKKNPDAPELVTTETKKKKQI